MYQYGEDSKEIPLSIVGSSVFGRYPKISTESTTNMFISDEFLIPYCGYIIGIPADEFDATALSGRAIYASGRLNVLIIVIDAIVYSVHIIFDQSTSTVTSFTAVAVGSMTTQTGPVYIAENNTGSILISDNTFLYVYQPGGSPVFQQVSPGFAPGYITFHDQNFICAQRNTNFWRLSDDGITWSTSAAFVGPIETKPDFCKAVVRVPSKGNMIFVMGENVTEAWFATGAQLFPYQRTNQLTIDYGCLSPATIAYMDEYVVWLAQNERSGPIIMYSTGGMPEKITTDGIDYLFSNMQIPSDSQAFLYRQDGHLIYHINFYTDNISLFYDFNTQKFFNACDQNLNYFIINEIAFHGNQYYGISPNTGNLYVYDTIFTSYEDAPVGASPQTYPIPRIRICKNIRGAKQEYFVLNDIGFTIESGETALYNGSTPAVDLSLSYDGGATFGNQWRYQLNGLSQRKNRLMWWQCGVGNDIVPQFMFWNIGRVVITDGVCHIRE